MKITSSLGIKKELIISKNDLSVVFKYASSRPTEKKDCNKLKAENKRGPLLNAIIQKKNSVIVDLT